MADLDDILGDDWEDEVEEGELADEEDPLAGLDDDDEDEAPIPAKTSKKKASKKKAGKKKASKKTAAKKAEPVEDDLFDDEEEEAPPPKTAKKKASKKKAAKKKAAKKAEPAAEEPAAEPEPAKKRRGPKPGTKRKPRAPKAGNDPLGSLRDELTSIAEESGEKEQLAQLKAEIRTAKQLSTKLNRFAAKAQSVAESQEAHVVKLETKLATLTGEEA